MRKEGSDPEDDSGSDDEEDNSMPPTNLKKRPETSTKKKKSASVDAPLLPFSPVQISTFQQVSYSEDGGNWIEVSVFAGGFVKRGEFKFELGEVCSDGWRETEQVVDLFKDSILILT